MILWRFEVDWGEIPAGSDTPLFRLEDAEGNTLGAFDWTDIGVQQVDGTFIFFVMVTIQDDWDFGGTIRWKDADTEWWNSGALQLAQLTNLMSQINTRILTGERIEVTESQV
jgi:hypothetical protein